MESSLISEEGHPEVKWENFVEQADSKKKQGQERAKKFRLGFGVI